ncbi:hypothetical protein BJV78DRAFT_1226119 [Lactifluus subvellereus]|nr:hypothetical protein BJV78DRAFT_1226119 [Lactifluus subvellereus]
MAPPLNMSFPVLPSLLSSINPVGPTQNKAPKSPFLKRAINCLHRHIFHPTHVSESDSSNKAYEVSNSGGPQPPKSNSPGNTNHHLSMATALGTSRGFLTPASSPGTSSSTPVQSTGWLAQSYVRSLRFCLCAADPELTNLGYYKEEQGFDHWYPRQLSGKKRARQEEGEEEMNLGEKMEQKKVKMGQKKVKELRFSKRKGEI